MTLEERESQLQSLLSKYDLLRDDIDNCTTAIPVEDAKEIKTIMIHVLNNNDKSKISENLKRLLVRASMAIVAGNDLKSFLNKHASLTECCYLYVSSYSSLNDLIYSMLAEPQAVSNWLGLPLEDLETLLKQDYETRFELIQLSQNQHLSTELMALSTDFPKLDDLRSTAWNVLSNRMDELSFTDEGKRNVMRCLWGQRTEFRKTLCENDFTGESIDELESRGGVRYLETLSESARNELNERYQLTERQLVVLDALATVKVPSECVKASAAGSDKESQRQRLIDLITKATADLKLIGNDCKVQSMQELNELCDILNWNRELLTNNTKVVQPTKFMLDYALQILQVTPDERIEKYEDLIAGVDNGSALHGLCLGLDKDDWCRKATAPLLLKPDVCRLITETDESACVTRSFCFADKSEARKFEKAVLEMGLSAADSFASQFESCFETKFNGTCKYVIILNFRSYPTASFRLDEKRHLNMTPQAQRALRDVRDSRSASDFLRDYGTHLLRGAQQLGGMTCHSVDISLPTEEPKASLQEVAHDLLERGLSQFLFLPNATKTANMDCVMSDGKTVNVNCVFQANLRGLQVAQPQLYAEIIKHCNPQRCVLIERNASKTNLNAIWNWIADKMPDMKQQPELLRKAWIKKAKQCGSTIIDLVASELRNAEEDNSDVLVEKTKQDIESSLAELGRFESAIEDDKLLGTLRQFFDSMQEFERLAERCEDDLPNPWNKYVGKRDEFKEFVVKFSHAWSENRQKQETFHLSESLTFLRAALNDDKLSNALKRAHCMQDATVKEMISAGTSAKSSAESKAFNKRLNFVTIENLMEMLNAELGKSCSTDPSSLKDVQWRISSLLKQALHSDDSTTSRRRQVIEDLLVERFGWRDGTFQNMLTADALHSLVSSIDQATLEKDPDDENMDIDDEEQVTEPNIGSSSAPALNGATRRRQALKVDGNSLNSYSKPIAAQTSAVAKKFNPRNPTRIQRAKQSKERESRRPFSDFLIDIPSELIYKSEIVKRPQLVMRLLRHRMDLNSSINNEPENRIVGEHSASDAGAHGSLPKKSHYETLCELIDEYDPNGICEIYHLLLESRYTLPLFNPLTGEHYLKLLREVSVSTSPSQPPVRLGDDVTLPRVVLISCRDPAESQLHEILRSVFHVNTLHANDVADETFTDQALTIDLGIGHIGQRSRSTAEGSLDAVLLVHVTGDYTAAMGFLRQFADVLIVEDMSSSSGASSFCSFVSEKGKDSLQDLVEVIRWTPTSGRVSIPHRDANFKSHGFYHLSIEAPNGDKLYIEMASALRGALTSVQQRKRNPLHSLDLLGDGVTYPVPGIVPFDIEQLLQANLRDVAETRSSFVLQKNFRLQYKHEERKIENRYDESERKKAESEIDKCVVQRKKDADKVAKLPLLTFFVQLLEKSDPSIRVMAVRKFAQGISARTENELQLVQKQIDQYHKLVTGDVSANKSEQELAANKQKYVEAKQKYQDAMLHVEHLWRELSHIYVASPNTDKYQHLPRLAAQHLLDGFSIELLDGDANLLNLTWIHAVFNALHSLMARDKRRIFVLSVMGVQSSGKSTLLNTMFGIKMRTSVGQCTRGINMQLLPVQGRPEYDYVLVLDTEGTRSPDFHGMEGNEKRDNQMATLSILLADATIIVNPGENDAATKEILPIVLMAYQGSKLAEDNGGRLSSMMFFVYNRIDTTQKEKLTNIIQTLAQSLLDAFKTVREMGGSAVANLAAQETSNCLFRHFTLDASNSSSSDVRILGQNKRSYEPPANVPDPKYGEALVEFREHIHKRVTQNRDGATWKSRSLIQLSQYIDNIWQCICSANFTLRFAHVVERSTFDQLEAEYQKCEIELASLYQAKFSELHKSMLKERASVDIRNSAATTKLSEEFQRKLPEAVGQTIVTLNGNVEQILSRKGREKWKVTYEQRWDLYKRKQSDHWGRQIKYSFDMIFLYENEVAKLKSELRQQIRKEFSGVTPEELSKSEHKLRTNYDLLISKFTAKVYDDYPPMKVKEAIDEVYKRNPTIKGNQVDVFNETTEHKCTEIFNAHRAGITINVQTTPQKPGIVDKIVSWINPSSASSSNKEPPLHLSPDDDANLKSIHEKIKTLLEGVERYDDGIVSTVIEETHTIIIVNNKKKQGGPISYSSREIAHVYARVTLTYYMKTVQQQWEQSNSVAARFTEKKSMDEMYVYFNMVLNGAKMINLFRSLLQNNFSDLSKAFEAEMVCLTLQKVKTQNWLYEIKWTQNYMDRYLLELIDHRDISKLIYFVGHPNKLFTVVMQRLIAQIAKDLLTTGKGWRDFKYHVRNAINLATERALASKNNRAAVFITELQTRLVDTLQADVLPTSIELNLGKEYNVLDEESDDEFRDAVETKLLEIIENQLDPSDKAGFSLHVSKLVIKQLRAENQPGAMPRCEAFCPWCKSTCTGKAGHDPDKQQHDTIHQPSGLAGVIIRGWNTLSSDICSSYEDTRTLYIGDDEFLFEDWCKKFPDWAKPHPTQDWPLREYIFYHYHRDFAKHYDRLPCKQVPESYNRDLSLIRETLEHGPIEF